LERITGLKKGTLPTKANSFNYNQHKKKQFLKNKVRINAKYASKSNKSKLSQSATQPLPVIFTPGPKKLSSNGRKKAVTVIQSMENDPSTVSGVSPILNRFPKRPNPILVIAITSQINAAQQRDAHISNAIKKLYDFSHPRHSISNRKAFFKNGEWNTPYKWANDTVTQASKRSVPQHPQNWKGWDNLLVKIYDIESKLTQPKRDDVKKRKKNAMKKGRNPTLRKLPMGKRRQI
jgi:hypothetical protein